MALDDQRLERRHDRGEFFADVAGRAGRPSAESGGAIGEGVLDAFA